MDVPCFVLGRQPESVPELVPQGANLTDRDQQVIQTLTHRVRVLTLDQIARTWFPDGDHPRSNASRRMGVLERTGLLARATILARPELVADVPVLRWFPGHAAPPFEKLAYGLVSRWTQPAVPTAIFMATRSAGIRSGGFGGRRPRRSEATHDVCLAGVYLRLLEIEPLVAQTWVAESKLRHRGFGENAMLPDAMMERGGRSIVVEFGGAYSAAKLKLFHEFCKGRDLPYELW